MAAEDDESPPPVSSWSSLHQEWLIHAPGREALVPEVERRTGVETPCPFCPGSAETPLPYDTQIVSSRYPFVPGLVESKLGVVAAHSVLLYTPEHSGRLRDLTVDRLVRVLRCVAAHTDLLFAGGRASVYAFEVHGDVFGPTVAHPHGQILGFPFVPQKMVTPGRGCALCEVDGSAELRLLDLPLVELGVSPWSRLPFEMIIYPFRHVGHLGQCADAEYCTTNLPSPSATRCRLSATRRHRTS